MNTLRLMPEARLDVVDLQEQARLARKARVEPLGERESIRLRRLDERWGSYEDSGGSFAPRAVFAIFVLMALVCLLG